MDVEKTPAPTCTCPSGDGSLRSPCPAHGSVPAINLQHEPLGFVLFPLSPAAVAPHVVEYIIGFDFDEVRDVYGERFTVFWRGLVGMFAGQPATVAIPVTGTQQVAGQQAPSHLATSEGGRRFIAEFFATELRRHDFADYISTRLAADFACALAQHLAATGRRQDVEVHGDARAQFEAWHCEKFKTRWQTGAPTRDMHNGVYAENYGPPEQQVRWEAWQAAWQAALAARQPGAQEPEAVSCTNCDLTDAQVICQTCAGVAWDNGRLHEFHETRELSTSLGEGPLDELVPEEWHEKPLLRFQGAYACGDDSVGVPARSGYVLAADQGSTVLGDFLAARAAKGGDQ